MRKTSSKNDRVVRTETALGAEVQLAALAGQVLRQNDMGDWTRAAPNPYPHQWSWDSAFIAIGLAHLSTRHAAIELLALFEHQWGTGKVPHPYVTDKGFEVEENHRRWLESYGVRIIHPPKKRNSRKRSWPKRLRRWVASIRQIIESVYEKLFNAFGLWRGRPHELSGLWARLAARVALHNFCMWLNEQLGRPRLAFADLLRW